MGLSRQYDTELREEPLDFTGGVCEDWSAVDSGDPEPITLTELKDSLRISHTEDDTLLTAIIVAARQGLERTYGVGIVAQTVTALFRPGARYLRLPVAPLTALTSVTHVDRSGVSQAQNLSEYFWTGEFRSVLHRNASALTSPTGINHTEVVYTAGFTNATRPSQLKEAVRLYAGTLYEMRSTLVIGKSPLAMPVSVRMLMQNYAEAEAI